MRLSRKWVGAGRRAVALAAATGLVAAGWQAHLAPENVLAILAVALLCG